MFLNVWAKNGNVEALNCAWDRENPGFEGAFRLVTVEDAEKWLSEIQSRKDLRYFRYLKTVEDIGREFPEWAVGTFQVILQGWINGEYDFLCSEMAKRYLKFLECHKKELTSNLEEVGDLLRAVANTERRAANCAVNCLFCMGMRV